MTETAVKKRRMRVSMDKKPSVAPMGDAYRAIVTPKAGRKRVPSIFLEDVQRAIETGETYQIIIPADMKPATIVSELDKAARDLHVKLKKWKRPELSPADLAAGLEPFVGFQVIARLAEEPPVTTTSLPKLAKP